MSNIGTFYYDDSANKKNGEFDVVLERKNAYDIYEVKYYSVPIRLKEMQEEERQVRASKACWSERLDSLLLPVMKKCPANIRVFWQMNYITFD